MKSNSVVKTSIDGIAIPNNFHVPPHISEEIGGIREIKNIMRHIQDSRNLDEFGKLKVIEELNIRASEKTARVSEHLRNRIKIFKTNAPTARDQRKTALSATSNKTIQHKSSTPTLHLNYDRMSVGGNK